MSVRRFVETCGDERWGRKASAKAWSPAECIIHLNKTSEMALPKLREAVRNAQSQNWLSDGPYSLDLVGKVLLRFTEPPYKLRAPSPAAFVPTGVEPSANVLRKFEELQREMINVVEASNGLALTRIRIPWPVYVRLRYNMFASLKMIPAHQRRHLWQAANLRG